MAMLKPGAIIVSVAFYLLFFNVIHAQIGRAFPSERKVIIDSVTGAKLVFLTDNPANDHKIYPTHNQWTSDGKWIIFRSDRVRGEAFAVNEENGKIIRVTEGGYRGMLVVARKSMRLYYMQRVEETEERGDMKVVEVNLDRLLSDVEAGQLQKATTYLRNCGTIAPAYGAGGDMALDANEDRIYFRTGKEIAGKMLPEGTEIKPDFGPRHMGEGPGGIAAMDLNTGKVNYVVSVPFQVGHIQTNPWVPRQIIFCWETGGKSPQRTWIVNSDGTGLRPLYPEASYEWVTHEAVITPTEVAFAIMGHRKIPDTDEAVPEGTGVKGANPGQEASWGNCGTREKPTGLGIVNIDTREMHIAGQIPYGSGFWHVHGSPDGRFAVGDNFKRELYLIDRETHEMKLLTAGHKPTADDHVHPTFSPDGTKIQIQSAMIAEDGEALDICVVYIPEEWME